MERWDAFYIALNIALIIGLLAEVWIVLCILTWFLSLLQAAFEWSAEVIYDIFRKDKN